jgi:kumamolisin
MFKPYLKHSTLKPSSREQAATAFFPTELANLYDFPYGDGTGQKVGVIELGGGFRPTDILIYFQNLGIGSTPNIISISVDGAQNDTSDQSGANFEVALDIEVIAALVPSALICVYFAPNTFSGFYNAINTAIEQGCKVISISWGAPEAVWTESEMNRFNTLFSRAIETKCTIIAAAGDNGSSDNGFGDNGAGDGLPGTNVDFPASSPYVLSCGGTTLVASNGAIVRETVWNDNPTGGGVSTVFDKPDYQMLLKIPKRGVPDICANADPLTGYRIFMAGVNYVIGGTSAVAPLWAALITRLNQRLGSYLGNIHKTIYQAPMKVCRATSGWNKCTGCGSPNGLALLTVLQKPESTINANFTVQFIKRNPFSVRFLDASTGNPIHWVWNFGDGVSLLNSQNPTHIFNKLGRVTISLTVSDKSGKTSTFTKTITVTR